MILTDISGGGVLVNWANVTYAVQSSYPGAATTILFNVCRPDRVEHDEPRWMRLDVKQTLTEIQDLISRERHGR